MINLVESLAFSGPKDQNEHMKEKFTLYTRREFLEKTIPAVAGFLLFGCGKKNEQKNNPSEVLSPAKSNFTFPRTPELPTSTPTPTKFLTPTNILEPTLRPIPEPTLTSELKKEITIERVIFGETGKKNPLVAEYLSQRGNPEGIILILGGTHPGENTGLLTDNQKEEGYLTKVQKWLLENKEEWEEFGVVLADINPDGEGRETPSRDDLGRNFGGEECPVCCWHKTDWQTRKVTDPSGDSPMSSSEAKATINLAKIFQEKGKILLAVFLHGFIPPKGQIDPGYCGETGNQLSCQISQKMAELSGAVYSEIFPQKYYGDSQHPSGIAGLSTDYFSVALGIPATCYEFPDKNPSGKNATKISATFCQAVLGAVKLDSLRDR